jgi:hypothetical protein
MLHSTKKIIIMTPEGLVFFAYEEFMGLQKMLSMVHIKFLKWQ